MNEIQVTWGMAARVWWSLAWRGMVFGGLAGFLAGVVSGLIGTAVEARPETIALIATVAGALVGIPVGIWVVRLVLGSRFRGYRIALVEPEAGS